MVCSAVTMMPGDQWIPLELKRGRAWTATTDCAVCSVNAANCSEYDAKELDIWDSFLFSRVLDSGGLIHRQNRRVGTCPYDQCGCATVKAIHDENKESNRVG